MEELFLEIILFFVNSNILEFSIPPDAKIKKLDVILNFLPMK